MKYNVEEVKEILDKLLIHLVLSKEYTSKTNIEETIAWRLKEGKTTDQDKKVVKWATQFLSRRFTEFAKAAKDFGSEYGSKT